MSINDNSGGVVAGSVHDTFRKNLYMFLLFSLVPLLFYRPMLQTDTYWLINTGKYILGKGFPYIEPFTFHEGLSITVQQWLSTVIFYLGYVLGGVAGVHILCMIVYAVIVYLIYRLALQISERNTIIAAYIAVFSGVCLYIFIVPRPQIFSLLIFILEIFLLERFIQNQEQSRWIIVGLPVLSAFLINLHAAMWPLLFLFCIPYFIDSFRFRFSRIEGQGFHRKALVLGLVLSFIAGFINPYGLRAVTYLFDSYGNALINDWVLEMASPDFKGILGIMLFIMTLTVVLIYFLVEGRSRLRYALITIGTLYMGLSSVRSFALFITFGFVFLAYYLKDINASKSMPSRRRAVLVGGAIVIMVFLRMAMLVNAGQIEEDHKPEKAVHFIKSNIDVSRMRLCNSFNAGGYIEFSGIKAFIDTRAEVFTKKLNGRADILQDFCGALNGSIYYADFAKKYSFTHFLLHKEIESLLHNCLRHDRGYKQLYEDKSYVLYEKIF